MPHLVRPWGGPIMRSATAGIVDASVPARPSLASILVLGAWFGLLTGLLEGLGLLIFQRINWQNWARMVHVSAPILWISPVVSFLLFVGLAIGGWGLAKIFPRLPILRVLVFLFAALAVYDWLALMSRLYYIACLTLALGIATVFSRWFVKHSAAVLRFARRTLPVNAALLILAFVVVQGGSWLGERRAIAQLPPAPAGAPNVLVIIMDALRADHVSAYGYPRLTTPEMDRLAAGGVLFENAFSTSSWSLPSHVSLVTGRYLYEHGAGGAEPEAGFEWDHPSFRGFPLVGEVMAKHGYRTAGISANRVFFTANDGFGRGFQHFADYFQSTKDALLRTLWGREVLRLYLSRNHQYRLHKRASEVNTELLDWIDRDPHIPFLAVLNYFDVHDPYGGPGNYPKPEWPLNSEIDEYDQGVKYCDDQLRFLMEALEHRGMAGNTIVIVTADHGESLAQHGLRTHGRALYRELIHVPLIVWSPGRVPSGVRVKRAVSNAGIPATAVDLGLPNTGNPFPGPLSALWRTTTSADTWPAPLSELGQNTYPEKEEKPADQVDPTSTTGYLRSLVTPEWHLISHENLGVQLYDWQRDPGENRNLANTTEGSLVALRLDALFPQGMLSRDPPDPAKAQLIGNGSFDIKSASGSVNQYFRVQVDPGSTLVVEVRTRHLKPASRLDPVLALQDRQGQPLQSCRNPGDDRLPAPLVSDPTPLAFDDVCINDDVDLYANTDSLLEFMAPADASTRMELYVHVLEWNKVTGGPKDYQLKVSGAVTPPHRPQLGYIH